ncbi:MAG: beta-glucosidase family protein [Promethearchaeota archaeon]
MEKKKITSSDQNEDYKKYLDPNAELEERVEDLLSRMTLEEKLLLFAGKDSWHTHAIERLKIPEFGMTDGPHGVRPKCIGGRHTTYFGSAILLASSWDPDLLEEFGTRIAKEVRGAGMHMLLAPGINICRTPINGRTFEYYTEDPFLNSKLVTSCVKGVQSVRIAACVKHFVVNNQEKNRFRYNAVVSERALREIYFRGFQAAVTEADAWSIMASYNKINGLYSCENKYLLTDVLRGEWNFRGFVVSDWGATRPIKSTAACVKAGLNLEMGRPILYKPELIKQSLENGEITIDIINKNTADLLRVMFLVGLFDPPELVPEGDLNSEANHKFTRKIAGEGAVLLKNENQILPLIKIDGETGDTNSNPKSFKNIAILGPNADFKTAHGGGSSETDPEYEVTFFQALREKINASNEHTASGDHSFSISLFKNLKDFNNFIKSHPNTNNFDIIFYAGGLRHKRFLDSEGIDRKNMQLPKKQLKELLKLKDYGIPIVLVLINGSPIEFERFYDHVDAILECWYPGMEGQYAIADIIFGDINPSGKLPITFPKKLEDVPAHQSKKTYPGGKDVLYKEDIFVGDRYFDTFNLEPRFPFGFGLSYTQFEFKSIELDKRELKNEKDELKVQVSIKNIGKRAGAEVVQLYISHPKYSEERPKKELKGFKKVFLEPDEEKQVEFIIKPSDLSIFSSTHHRWVIISGTYEILIGSSSRDIFLKEKFNVNL